MNVGLWRTIAFMLLSSFLLIQPCYGGMVDHSLVVQDYKTGQKTRVSDDRTPALYTGKFVNCRADDPVRIILLNVAFYRDNMTLALRLTGETKEAHENITLLIGISAFGQSRFEIPFSPCHSVSGSMCPMRANTTIEATALIPTDPKDVDHVPEIAYFIPDFDGTAEVTILSNETAIGCSLATLTNGSTLSANAIVGTLLGMCIIIAVVASVATAVYGRHMRTMQKHYAHSISVTAVFAVLHHVYYSGALSVDFPGVVVAFWSNFAWYAGMINVLGNVDSVPGEYTWFGKRVDLGLPFPGDFFGFTGTLAQSNIPGSAAFATGLFWLFLVLLIVVLSAITLKWFLEGLKHVDTMDSDRLSFFRTHWIEYLDFAVFKTLYAASFHIVFLAVFEAANYYDNSATMAMAVIVYVIFTIAIFWLSSEDAAKSTTRGKRVGMKKLVPWNCSNGVKDSQRITENVSTHSLSTSPVEERTTATDLLLMKRSTFSWFRYRQSRCNFPFLWLGYEIARAVWLGALTHFPRVQVFGLLGIESFFGIFFIKLSPFKSQRLNLLMFWCLGFSKIATLVLSSCFIESFEVTRLSSVMIGFVIITIHSILIVVLLITIGTGVVTSWMSVMRDREDFRPRRWIAERHRFFKHIEEVERNQSRSALANLPDAEPQFDVADIQRIPKIEDEDVEFMSEILGRNNQSGESLGGSTLGGELVTPIDRPATAGSMRSLSSGNVPRAAMVHRYSWSAHDFHVPHSSRPDWERGRSLSLQIPLTSQKAHADSASARSSTPVTLPASALIRSFKAALLPIPSEYENDIELALLPPVLSSKLSA